MPEAARGLDLLVPGRGPTLPRLLILTAPRSFAEAASIDFSLIGEYPASIAGMSFLAGHTSSVPELGEVITVISHVASLCCP